MDMIRSMMRFIGLPILFQVYSLETMAHIQVNYHSNLYTKLHMNYKMGASQN